MKIDYKRLARRIARDGLSEEALSRIVELHTLCDFANDQMWIERGTIRPAGNQEVPGLLFQGMRVWGDPNRELRADFGMLIAPEPVMDDFVRKVSDVATFAQHDWLVRRVPPLFGGFICSLLAVQIEFSVRSEGGMVVARDFHFAIYNRPAPTPRRTYVFTPNDSIRFPQADLSSGLLFGGIELSFGPDREQMSGRITRISGPEQTINQLIDQSRAGPVRCEMIMNESRQTLYVDLVFEEVGSRRTNNGITVIEHISVRTVDALASPVG